MKVMKCPECEEVSTFTCSWTATIEYWGPLMVDKAGDIQFDYDASENSGEDENDWDECYCQCDTCGQLVEIDNIEVVDAEEEVPAE